jgi:hypothetical protein
MKPLTKEQAVKLIPGTRLICIDPNGQLNINGIYIFIGIDADGVCLHVKNKSAGFYIWRFAIYKKTILNLKVKEIDFIIKGDNKCK